MSRRAIAALLGLFLWAGVLAGPPAGANDHYTASEVMFPSEDGTQLYAQVFRPSDKGENDKTPVVVVMTPYQIFGAGAEPRLLYPELDNQAKLFERGYTIVQASLRGYGRSEGCGDFGGPGEQSDSVAAVEWAASQPWSTGKVGMYGISYDAWTQVMALAGDAKGLSAAVVSSPLISAYRGLYMNRVHYAEGWHATPLAYGAIDLASPGTPNAQSPNCYASNAYETAGNDPSALYWKERNLIPRASKSDVPTFWTFGFMDANTKPDNFLDVYSELDGPKRAWFGQFRHQLPMGNVGNTEFINEVVRFFELHLVDEGAARDPDVEVQDGGSGRWRIERSWPPEDASRSALPILEGTYRDSYSDDEGPAGERGTWTFSQPLPYDVHIAGVPNIDVVVESARGGSHVHARLFDVSGTQGKLISRGAEQIPGLPSDAIDEKRVRFDLYPQDWVLEKGHRIGLLITGADLNWFDPGVTGAEITVKGGFSLGFLRFKRTNYLTEIPSPAMSSVERLTLDRTVITERTLRMPLPPRLR